MLDRVARDDKYEELDSEEAKIFRFSILIDNRGKNLYTNKK